MVIGRAFRATGCASCRLSLIRSFTSSTGSATRVPRAPTRYPRSGTPSHFRYSSQLTRDNQYLDEVKKDDKEARSEEEELEDLLEEELDAEYGTKDGGEVSAIPWYLQVESPTRTPQPLSERQKIPELPATPPPILEPLLQQISVDLGMDDLKLLDLRKLDPPPALGANLLMILGTARSERHLHVSADRLCRWLRSTYKLRPDADGLLGRNELKLKLKRKAKRAKLLGSAADENGDDGVRTGWVCVDLGVVEPDAAAVEAPQRQDFIGFGRRVDGVRIVVQMLTEEKREEIELERLWEGILKRGGQHELESPVEDQENHISTPDSSRSPSLGSPASTLGQRRAMHTSARRPSMMQESIPESAYHMPPGPASATPFETFDLRTIQEEAQRYINSGNFEQAATHLKSYSNIIPALKGDGWQKILLTSLRIHIENVPKSQALEELSIPAPGSEPTPFMACFQSAMTFYPTQFAVESEIWLHSFARTIEHPDYDLPTTAGFLKKLQGYGVQISKASYMVLIRSLLLLKQDNGPKRESAHIVLDILRVMQDQGLQILDENMFVELQELTEPPKGYVYQQYWVDQTPFTYDIESQMPTALQRRLHLIMMKLDFPPFSDELTIRLLNLHARNRCWSEFWDVFSMAPRALVAQSPAVYAYMFACVANSGSQKGCMTVLRNWVPRMESEDPPVKLEGDVAAAVKVCVMIADPTVVKDQKNTSKSRGEWGRLWDRCQ